MDFYKIKQHNNLNKQEAFQVKYWLKNKIIKHRKINEPIYNNNFHFRVYYISNLRYSLFILARPLWKVNLLYLNTQ